MSEEVEGNKYKDRIAICKECPFYSHNSLGTCNVCGCPMKVKARIPLFHCPKKRW